MLDFVLFIILSVLESSALFYLGFKLFKIDLYSKEIIFAGIIMAFFSYVLRYDYQLAELDVLVQYTLIICFLWLLFRIHIFYAFIMTAIAYQSYLLIQSLLYLIIDYTGIYGLNYPTISTGIYILQILTATTTIIIANYVGKRRKGFDFIPDKPDEKITIGKREKIMFILTIPSIIFAMLMLFFAEHLFRFFFIIPLIYALLLFGYLYQSDKKIGVMILNSLALKISLAIKKTNPEETVSVEVMQYALSIILNTLLTFIVSLSIGLILNNLKETLIFYISLSLLRVFSGGVHLKSATACNIVTILICSMTPYLFQLTDTILWFVTAFSLILVLLFAPNPDKNTQIPVKWYPSLKLISVIMVCLNFFIASSVIGLAFLVQSVTIIPWKRRC